MKFDMKISPVNTNKTNFKAHTYTINPQKQLMLEIRSEGRPNLGKEPYLVSNNLPSSEKHRKMKCIGSMFYSNILSSSPVIKYHIEYKDTGNKDLKNGKDYEVNKKKLLQDANLFLRKQYRQPIIHAIKSGKTAGKLIDYDKLDCDDQKNIHNAKKPVILLTSSLLSVSNNPNIVGVINKNDDMASLSHFATQYRNYLDVAGVVFDPDIISKLEDFEGQNIEIELKDNFISFNKTDITPKGKKYPKITVPKLKYSDKILSSKEYSPDIIGAKAVNLRRLEELVEKGKINVIIPKSIALPYGYIEKILNENNDNQEEPLKDGSIEKIEELKKYLSKNSIESRHIMVRSAFNGEDLPDYSAAGIYKTTIVFKDRKTKQYPNEDIYSAIKHVALSKDSIDAKRSRARYQIPDEDIKPGIIIQEGIHEDYKFTLYTDNNEGKIKIDLYSGDSKLFIDSVQPHCFTYNKKTGNLSYDSIQMDSTDVIFDENMNVIKSAPMTNDLSDNKALFKQLENLCKSAMVIEKEFNAPQDIEGGIKDGKIYLWQTRNIVNY